MVNGDYWIYSDGNGQTILARCEGTAIWSDDKVHVAGLTLLHLNKFNY